MIAFVKLALFLFVALTVVYLSVSVYSRSVRRERLEKSWDADPPVPGDDAARDAFIEDGMQDYEHGLRKRLIWLVYIIPTIAVLVLIYVTNYA